MSNFTTLLAGDLQRMKKYHILTASFAVALVWIGVLYFAALEEVGLILPLVLFMDAVSMTILLVGSTVFFEKQEGALRSMLVSPIQGTEYILAKAVAGVFTSLLTLAVLYFYIRFVMAVSLDIVGLTGAVALVGLFHSLLGFFMIYHAADFTGLLMNMMKYFFLLAVPVILAELDLITSRVLTGLFYLLPTRAAMALIQAPVAGRGRGEAFFSVLYLGLLSAVLFFIVRRGFQAFAAREGGV